MSYLEELLPEFRKGTKIMQPNWAQGEYIYLGENGIVYDERNKPFDFTNEELLCEWELYQEPEPDWDYIINNKCLCWFWNDDENGKYLGTIRFINKNADLPFMNWERGYAKHCRPVRKYEVTFYEDRNDE